MCDYAKDAQLKTGAAMTGGTYPPPTMADMQNAVAAQQGYSPRRPSLREEMEKAQYRDGEQAQLRSEAIDFLRDNPAFDQFISLLRKGAISI